MNIVPLVRMSADHVRRYSTDRNFSGNSVDPDQILHYVPAHLIWVYNAQIQQFSSGGGVQVNLTKKTSDNVFFRNQLILQKSNG